MAKYKAYILLIIISFVGGIITGVFLFKLRPLIQVRFIPKKPEVLEGKSYIMDYPTKLTFRQEERSIPEESQPLQVEQKNIQFPRLPGENTKYINGIWSTFQHDNKRTGRSPFSCSTADNVKWSFRTMSIISSSPSVGPDGTIYIGSFDNNLYAIRPNGKLKWRFSTGSIIISSPTISGDGTIYVGSNDKNLYAINSDGTLKWVFTTGDIILTSAAVDNDSIIYFGSNDGNLYALASSGLMKWKFTTGGAINHSSPAIGDDGTIFIGSGDGFLYAVNKDGTMKWKFQTGGAIKSSPSLDSNGTIFIGSDDGYFYSIKQNGSLNWRYNAGAEIMSSAAIDRDGTLFFGALDEYLYALTSDGNLKWKFKAGSPVAVSPAISDNGVIFFGSTTGYFYAITTGGKLLWRRNLGLFQGSPSIGHDGTVFVGSMLHKLIAFGPPMPTVKITVNKEKFSKNINDFLTIKVDANSSDYHETEVKVWIKFPDGVNRTLDSFKLFKGEKRIRKTYTYNFTDKVPSGSYRISSGIFNSATGEQFDISELTLHVN